MLNFFVSAGATFLGLFLLGPLVAFVARRLGLYTIVRERQCKVYVLFGKVIAEWIRGQTMTLS